MHLLQFRRLTVALGITSLLAPSFAHAATLLYVTNGTGDRATIYNTDDNNEEVGRISLGDQPNGIVISGTGAYAANSLSDTISVIDTTTNQLVTTIAVGDAPHSMAVSGTGLYVTNMTDGTVTVIDTTDNQVVTTISVGNGPRNIAISGTGVYVANFIDDTVSVFDTTDNQVVTTVAVGDRPHGLGINGTGAYVTNLGSNTVSIIDITDNQVITAFAVGSQPEGIAFYGTGAYVTNYNGDTVSVIDTTDNQSVTTISAGDGPTFVRINGTGAYVTNYLGSTVSVIDVTTNTVDETISTTQPFDVAFYDDTATLAPTLVAPASGASVELCDDLTITYTLPETPLSGSVRLQFFNETTIWIVTATLNNSTGATFSLDLEDFTAVANVVSSTANSIAAGNYTVYLSYQDQFGNAAANFENNDLTVTACTFSSSSSSSSSTSSVTTGGGGGVREVTLQMKQEAAAKRFGDAYQSSSSSTGEEQSPAIAGYFTDVPLSAWFYEFIEQLRSSGIVSGYRNIKGEETKMFGPGDNVTYGQLAKMITTLIKREPASSKVNVHWAEPYVREARKSELTVFIPETLNLDSAATRAAVVRTILQAYGISLEALPQNTFLDLPTDHPYAKDMLTALSLGIISGDGNNQTVRPDAPINRAELSKILVTISKRFTPKPVAVASSSSAASVQTSSVSPTQSSADKDIRHVTTAILNVRSDARINSTLLWAARQGQEFEVLRIVGGDWAHVRVSDGNEGYVWARHLSD